MAVKTRYIKPGEARRVMVRTTRCRDLVLVEDYLESQGFERVGLLRFIRHIVFWRKMS